jgi:hypothetical protein
MRNILYVLVFLLSISSCSYKPLYKKNAIFSKYRVEISIKSKGKYENNANLMESILNQRFKHKGSVQSNLKLVVSIDRSISNLGINKDLFTFGKMLVYDIAFSFYDKKGLLTSGKLSGKSTYNIGKNTYANIVSKEDASKKLISSLSQNLVNIITAMDFKRTISP